MLATKTNCTTKGHPHFDKLSVGGFSFIAADLFPLNLLLTLRCCK